MTTTTPRALTELIDPNNLEELERVVQALRNDLLGAFVPNPKQMEFCNSTAPETALTGLNQGGKSYINLFKGAIHSTGLYPRWWKGHRFKEPIHQVVAGETAKTTRDLLTDRLFGTFEDRGSGLLPAESFDPDKIQYVRGGGVNHQIDIAPVKWYRPDGTWSGKYSYVHTMAYSTGYQSMQGYVIKDVRIDEEPPFKVYDELSARLNYTQGVLDITFTPLQGYTELYNLFANDKTGHRRHIIYGIDDATHLTRRQEKTLRRKYKGHFMELPRLHGLPTAGRGVIYPLPDEELVIPPTVIPDTFPQIIGVDFNHTTSGTFAAVRMAIDPALGKVYLMSVYKESGKDRGQYIEAVRRMGGDRIPIAWPHDGGRVIDDRPTAEVYRAAGLRMLPEFAHYLTPDGQKSWGTTTVIDDVFELMASGQFKVFETCEEFLKERRTYRSDENGRPARKQDDHAIDAMHKAVMMRRHAEPPGSGRVYSVGALPRRRMEFDFYSI